MMNPRMAAGNTNLIKFFQWLSGWNRSNLAQKQQDQEHDQNHPHEAHAGMAVPVAVAPETAGEAAEEQYDQDNDEYRSKRHGALLEGRRAPPPKTLSRAG